MKVAGWKGVAHALILSRAYYDGDKLGLRHGLGASAALQSRAGYECLKIVNVFFADVEIL